MGRGLPPRRTQTASPRPPHPPPPPPNPRRPPAPPPPEHGRPNRALLAGVVAGIAHYGNAFGVPTIGGEVVFDDAYGFNPLVNAFALGLVRHDQIFFGKAAGVGNPVLYVGAET